MSRKKRRSGKKKKSTYKPKYAREFDPSKKADSRDQEKLLIPKDENEGERKVVSKDELPQEYNPPENLSYTFPPFIIVGVLILIIVLLAIFLF